MPLEKSGLSAEKGPNKLSELIPQKLRAIFSRRGRTGGDKSLGLPTDVFHTVEGDNSVIHPDIEEGARYVLEDNLIKMVKTGNAAGIKICIRSLGQVWQQAQKAAKADFELTPEGRKEMPSKVKEICVRHLSDGLANIFSSAATGVRFGLEYSIEHDPTSIRDLFNIAEEFKISLSYLHQHGEVYPAGNDLAVIINTPDQALAHLQEIIDGNLPGGLLNKVASIGIQVGNGLLEKLPDYEKQIEKWIGIMEQRGWTIMDDSSIIATEEGIQQEGSPRRLNRADIRQLIDQEVYNNLATGAKFIAQMVAYNIRCGSANPLEIWGNPENIALYRETGERFGLIKKAGVVDDNSEVNKNLYFNPDSITDLVRDAVRVNIDTGIQTIMHHHLEEIRKGDVEQIELHEATLERYIDLGREFDVPLNAEKLRLIIKRQLTPENLQQGVRSWEEKVKEDLRIAYYLGVSVHPRKAELFRQYVEKLGLGKKVAFLTLDHYFEETATNVPRLTD